MVTALGSVEPGQLLGGRYRVTSRLAGGGMAEVFLARDGRLDRDVAIKVLRAETAADPDLRRRFATEGRVAARLSHPNVVGVYDVGEEEGQPYLVMELVAGETLAEMLRPGPLSEDVASRVGLDILAGLGTVHSAGIVHRDVKPGNVLINQHGTAKLTDFGIAKSGDSSDGVEATATALVIGTPSYLAPERAAGAPASVASDLWAVGVVLYEALAGVRPFQGPSPLAVALAARNGEVVPLGERRPDISPALSVAVERALRADPTTRYADAAAMAAAVEGSREWGPPAGSPTPALAITAEDPTVTGHPASTEVLERGAFKRSSRARIFLAVGSVVAVCALLLGWALSRGGSPTIAHRVPPTTIHAPVTTSAAHPSTPATTTAPPPPAHPTSKSNHGHGNDDNGKGDNNGGDQ